MARKRKTLEELRASHTKQLVREEKLMRFYKTMGGCGCAGTARQPSVTVPTKDNHPDPESPK